MITRRDFLVGSVFGMALPELLARTAPPARAKSCILIWLNGGPSHLDMFDLKPNAPNEVRGPFKPMKTKLDGVHVCEHLPKTAALLHKTTLIRTLTSPEGNHDRAAHHLLTGYRPTPALVYPGLGSVAAKEFGVGKVLPNYVTIPDAPAYGGSGYLTASYDPFEVNSNPARNFKVKDLASPVPEKRVDRRRKMLESIDTFGASVGDYPARDTFLGQAFGLVSSKEARAAFDLSQEDRKTRQRYGFQKIGQSCLLARRLVEAGTRFVTVNDTGWDTHVDAKARLAGFFNKGKMIYRGKLPDLDNAWPALIQDLDDRGLLETTLVIVMGEFGRTPKLNSRGGRDHWPRANFALLAGGGVKRGQVVGKTDPYGELPDERAVHPEDLLQTVYHLLGIDPDLEYHTETGRPVKILGSGSVVREALA